MAAINPIRYRGYYYDTDTELYYLLSRYYDPEICRFLNADSYASTGQGIFGTNMFAYCVNNPVVHRDTSGHVVETALDFISLGSSIAEVITNPANPWAWAGLVGDAIDVAIPFVGGIGESVDAIKIVAGVVRRTDDVVDAAKVTKKYVSKATGTYVITYQSGKHYIGKGPFSRAITSAKEHTKPNKLNNMNGDTVKSITWKSAPDSITAYIREYLLQELWGGVLSTKKTLDTYNKIWSPGRNFLK